MARPEAGRALGRLFRVAARLVFLLSLVCPWYGSGWREAAADDGLARRASVSTGATTPDVPSGRRPGASHASTEGEESPEDDTAPEVAALRTPPIAHVPQFAVLSRGQASSIAGAAIELGAKRSTGPPGRIG